MIKNRSLNTIRIFATDPLVLDQEKDSLIISKRILSDVRDENYIILNGYGTTHFERCDVCHKGVKHHPNKKLAINDHLIICLYPYSNKICSDCIRIKKFQLNIFELKK